MEIRFNKTDIKEALLQYLVKEKGLDYDELSSQYTFLLEGNARTINRMFVEGIHDNLDGITITLRKCIKFATIVNRTKGIVFKTIK